MNEPQLDAATILRRFRVSDVHVVLIGGMAAIALGVPYLTQDIDFCYDASEENCSRLVAALASLRPHLARRRRAGRRSARYHGDGIHVR